MIIQICRFLAPLIQNPAGAPDSKNSNLESERPLLSFIYTQLFFWFHPVFSYIYMPEFWVKAFSFAKSNAICDSYKFVFCWVCQNSFHWKERKKRRRLFFLFSFDPTTSSREEKNFEIFIFRRPENFHSLCIIQLKLKSESWEKKV